VEEMTREEIATLVRDNGFGILSLAKDDSAYGIPLFYGYDGLQFYFQSRPGLKDPYIRATKEGCLTIVSLEGQDLWQSVQAVGPIHRVTREKEQLQASDVLMKVPFPPEFGFTPPGRPRRSNQEMFMWILKPTRVVGRKSESARKTTSQAFA
jgi:uncharacterized protein